MYRIVWATVAQTELAAIWNAAPPSDDELLVWAVSDLVYQLEREPENEGESRPMDTRVAFCRPLAIWFEVRNDDSVWIRHVWRYRTS